MENQCERQEVLKNLVVSKKDMQRTAQGENDVLIACKARWDEQLKGLVELERRCLTLREELAHSERKTRRSDRSDGEQERHAEGSTREISGEDLRGVQGAGGAEGERSFGARTKEAQADQVGRRKEKGKAHAKVGGVKSNRSMVRRP